MVNALNFFHVKKGELKMTIKKIIALLKREGSNTKKKVADMLENASISELQELRWSITYEINKKKGKEKQE